MFYPYFPAGQFVRHFFACFPVRIIPLKLIITLKLSRSSNASVNFISHDMLKNTPL